MIDEFGDEVVEPTMVETMLNWAQDGGTIRVKYKKTMEKKQATIDVIALDDDCGDPKMDSNLGFFKTVEGGKTILMAEHTIAWIEFYPS